MSTDRDTTRIVRSWLDEGVTQLPDRVLDAVLDQVPATPQRRTLWFARRFPLMNTSTVRYGIAAAVLIAAALLGTRFLSDANLGEDTSTPTPSASPTRMQEGGLEPGTYSIARGSFTRRTLTISVPEGWTHNDNFVSKGDAFSGSGVTLVTWIISHVYADSCQWEGTLREVGSAAELATALAEQTGHETSGPTDVTLGGLPAKRLEFSVPTDADLSSCDMEFLRLWPDAGPNENFGLPIDPGQTTTVYVVDLGTDEMVVATVRNEESSAADVTELEQVLASIRFQP